MADFNLSLPFSNYGSLPFDFTMGEPASFNYTLQVTILRKVTLNYPLQVITTRRVTLNYSLRVITGVLKNLNYPLKVSTGRVFSVSYPLSVTTGQPTVSFNYKLRFRVRKPVSFSFPLQVTTSHRSISLNYPVRISTGIHSNLNYPLLVETRDLGSNSYPGGSYLPGYYSDHSLRWSTSVILDGQDISSRLTGTIKIIAAINSARLADISILPSASFTKPFSLTGKSVQVFYQIKNSSGEIVQNRLRFLGVVDKPMIDLSTGIITLNCTDNLPKVASGMKKADLKKLVSGSSWSSFIFQIPKNNWEYTQNLLLTSPVAIFIPPGGNIICKNLWVDKVSYSATADTIVDGSLSVNLPSLSDIVNSEYVTFEITKQELKEQITSLNWQGEVGPPTGAACGVQQIFDAVSSAGAKFVDEPAVATPPQSQYYTKNLQTVAVINSGNELLCSSISGMVSRRYVQPTTNIITYLIQNKESIANLGVIERSETYSIPVVLAQKTEDWFLQEETVTRWWATASGLQIKGGYSNDMVASYHYRPGNGFLEPYPVMSATLPIWAGSNPLSSDIYRKKAENHTWTTGSTSPSDTPSPGVFAISTVNVTAKGTPAEIEEAIYCGQAKARTTIISSHRSATTTFTLVGLGLVELCDTVYVNTSKVETKGIVTSFTESLNIMNGEPLTEVVTSSSMTKATGLSTELNAPVRLSYDLQVTTVEPGFNKPLDYVNLNAYTAVGSVGTVPDLTQNVLKQWFYTEGNEISSEWYGHIAPIDNPNSSGGGQNMFVIPWPATGDNQEITINRNHTLSQAVIPEDIFQLKYV